MTRMAAGLAYAVLFFLGTFGLARAGDMAELNVLGFSPDGKIFAFEEYGVFDGSGFPYANRFYIDTATDSFLPGTPVRVRLEDDAATLEQARAKAGAAGQKIIADAVLAVNRGYMAGMNALTELSADPHRMAVNPRPIFPPVDEVLEFRMEEIPLLAPVMCEAFGEHVGFRLLRIDARDGGRTELLHEDKTTPASRNCPNGYFLGGVQTFFPAGAPPVYAVLIAVRSYGFEGSDYRWIAIPRQFPE